MKLSNYSHCLIEQCCKGKKLNKHSNLKHLYYINALILHTDLTAGKVKRDLDNL